MLTDLFDSLFRSSSPEVQKKQRIRKIENELKQLPNGIYRNGLIQPNFAEILRVLYINTRPIYNILEATIAGPDIKRNTRFEFQLLVSCYEEKWQLVLKDLEYEPRKQEIVLADLQGTPAARIFDDQKRRLDKTLSQLNTKEFIRMDSVFVKLKQLVELCRFNFVTPLKAFDPKFNSMDPKNTGNFSAVAPIALENVFLDLYYIIADFQMNMSVANAIIALAQIINMDSMTSEKQKQIVSNLKKIEQACHNILSEPVLANLIRLSKQNPDFVPQKASYSADIRQRFSSHIQEQYSSDELRIKGELKDERIKTELNHLFSGKPLLPLSGYNEELNEVLLQNSSVSFTWMTPLKILKSFSSFYYTESLKTLFNDIVIEGFFNNPNYKSQFSQTVFSANEVAEKIQAFENSFSPGSSNYDQIIKGYIRDSHKDSDFSKKLVTEVESLNAEAKSLIQHQVTALFSLYNQVGDLLQDAKKPSCEIVSNLKLLMMSSRNKDSTDFIEKNYEKWKVFFDIMKNYAIITTVDKK